jgi:hypothetical protein
MSLPNVQAEQVRSVIERARGTALALGIIGLILWVKATTSPISSGQG